MSGPPGQGTCCRAAGAGAVATSPPTAAEAALLEVAEDAAGRPADSTGPCVLASRLKREPGCGEMMPGGGAGEACWPACCCDCCTATFLPGLCWREAAGAPDAAPAVLTSNGTTALTSPAR